MACSEVCHAGHSGVEYNGGGGGGGGGGGDYSASSACSCDKFKCEAMEERAPPARRGADADGDKIWGEMREGPTEDYNFYLFLFIVLS